MQVGQARERRIKGPVGTWVGRIRKTGKVAGSAILYLVSSAARVEQGKSLK
jgi:hypothetical protein